MDFRIEDNCGYYELNEIDLTKGETRIGTFKFKGYKTPLDVIESDKIYRELIGHTDPIGASEASRKLAWSLSELKTSLVSYPDWWNDGHIPGGNVSANIVYKLMEISLEIQTEYTKKVEERIKSIKGQIDGMIEKGKIEKKEEESESLEAEE